MWLEKFCVQFDLAHVIPLPPESPLTSNLSILSFTHTAGGADMPWWIDKARWPAGRRPGRPGSRESCRHFAEDAFSEINKHYYLEYDHSTEVLLVDVH